MRACGLRGKAPTARGVALQGGTPADVRFYVPGADRLPGGAQLVRAGWVRSPGRTSAATVPNFRISEYFRFDLNRAAGRCLARAIGVTKGRRRAGVNVAFTPSPALARACAGVSRRKSPRSMGYRAAGAPSRVGVGSPAGSPPVVGLGNWRGNVADGYPGGAVLSRLIALIANSKLAEARSSRAPVGGADVRADRPLPSRAGGRECRVTPTVTLRASPRAVVFKTAALSRSASPYQGGALPLATTSSPSFWRQKSMVHAISSRVGTGIQCRQVSLRPTSAIHSASLRTAPFPSPECHGSQKRHRLRTPDRTRPDCSPSFVRDLHQFPQPCFIGLQPRDQRPKFTRLSRIRSLSGWAPAAAPGSATGAPAPARRVRREVCAVMSVPFRHHRRIPKTCPASAKSQSAPSDRRWPR